MPEKLSQHDARVLSATIALALATVGSGRAGREALNFVGESDSRARDLIDNAIATLSRSSEWMDVRVAVVGSADVFLSNMQRVQAIARLLLGDKNGGVAVEVEPVEVVTDVDKAGAEIGTKRYALWITHDEIHLLHWALKAAEAIKAANSLSEMQENTEAYIGLRDDVVDETAFDAFVTKFDNIHRQARIDDGEENGVTSTPESQPDLHD